MKKQIILDNIKDIEIDGVCQKIDYYCIHDVTLIYYNELIKSTSLDYFDIKYILEYLNKKHSHFK